MDESIRRQFDALCCRLSPENLCCDGELSRSQTQVRYRQIKKEWRALEIQVGRKVSQDEIEGYMFQQIRSKA